MFSDPDPTRGTSEPDRLWCSTNLVEATPEVLSPFCWTFWTRGSELGSRANYADLGVIRRSDVFLPPDQNQRLIGCFYGRQAINVDMARQVFGAIPGVDAEEFVLNVFGIDSSDKPPVKVKPRRLAVMAARAPLTVAVQGRRLAALHRESSAWWRRDVLRADSDPDPFDLLRTSADRFQLGIREQTFARGFLVGLVGQVQAIAEQAGLPKLALSALSGFGGVQESLVMDDLWLVSRQQLRMEEFLLRHGYHGPSEGNPIGHSWRESPDLVEALTAQLRKRKDEDRPQLRQLRTQASARSACGELIASLPMSTRPRMRALIRATATMTRKVEVAKSCYLMGVDGARLTVRHLGARYVATGYLDEPDDAFYFTYDELLQPLPVDVRQLVKQRQAQRYAYRELSLPITFTGMPVPIDAGALHGEATSFVDGIAASPGTVVGRVHILHDPSAPDLEEGEVVVCHTTDPGWCGVFTLAAALVIDVGAASSHGAIIARELGLPCVIGTVDGTTRLHEGDIVQVDGDSGRVAVLERTG